MVKTNMKARMVTDTYHKPTLVHRGQMGKRQQPGGVGWGGGRERERERKMGEGERRKRGEKRQIC